MTHEENNPTSQPTPAHPELSKEQVEELLRNYPVIPGDVMRSTLEWCKQEGTPPTAEILRTVLTKWLADKQSEAQKLFDNFRVSQTQFTIKSSTVSLWYRDSYGMTFEAFAESDHTYYVLVKYPDGEARVQTVEKAHTK